MTKDLLWTEDEENTLKYKAGKMPLSRLASSMGRTQGSVRWKASTLGISLRTKSICWTEDRLLQLCTLKFANTPWSKIAKEMGVTVRSCQRAYYRYKDEILEYAEATIIEEIVNNLRPLISDEEILDSIREHLKSAKLSDFTNLS